MLSYHILYSSQRSHNNLHICLKYAQNIGEYHFPHTDRTDRLLILPSFFTRHVRFVYEYGNRFHTQTFHTAPLGHCGLTNMCPD